MAIDRLIRKMVKFKNETVPYWHLAESLKDADFYVSSLYPTVIIKEFENLSKDEISQKLNQDAWKDFVGKMEKAKENKV